jgi:hypothetical protein
MVDLIKMPVKLLFSLMLLITLGSVSYASGLNISVVKLVGRGVEIRYHKMELNGKEAPKEIVIDEVTYPLFKTKKEAVDHVRAMAVKKDLTIVYVLSDEEKKTEFVTVED